MAVNNLYSNLPGHLVEFKDGGLQLTSTTVDTSSSKSLLILGTATDGPINEPVRIDATTVSQVFGKEVDANGYPNGATLTKYAKQAFKNGFDDVRCMRVTGSQAYTTIYGNETVAYEEATGQIIGSEQADGKGKVQGNAQFEMDFTTVDGDKFFVSKEASDADYFLVTLPGQTEAFRIELNESNPNHTSKNMWDPYRGFVMQANQYPAVASLVLHTTKMEFIGSDAVAGDTTGLVKSQDASLTLTTDSDSGIVTGTFDTKVNVDGTDVIPTIFDDITAHTTDHALPDLSDFSNGFKLMNGTTLLAEGTDYTKAIDTTTGVVTITFDASSGVADTDTITATFYPVKYTPNTEITFTQQFNDSVNDTVINVSALDDLRNPVITHAKVGGQVANLITLGITDNDGVVQSDANGDVTINILPGMQVGDVIEINYKYDKPVLSDLEIKVKSQWGGSAYKSGAVEVKKQIDGTNTYTVIEFTHAKTGKKYSYSSQFYHTIDDLVLAMKNDGNNLNMFELEIVKGDGMDSVDLLSETALTTLSEGGEDGLKPTNNEMFKALSGVRYQESDLGSFVSPYSTQIVTEDMIGYLKTQGAYQILENYNVDYIYPAGIYADSEQTVNPNSDFQRELALVCAVLTYRTKMTHGFIDVKPNSNTTLVGIDAYVSKLINNHPNIYYMTDSEGNVIYDSDNKPMDIGWYTSVVVGPEPVMVSDTLGQYYGSPAIAYAGLNAVIAPQSSPLNKALRNVNGMKFKFSNKQMDAIIGQRMVCFKLKNEGLAVASSTPYVVDGITSGARGCDYSDIAIVKTVTDVVDQIREVADPFIGEQNTVEQRNALSALISKRLAKLVEIGEIQAYEFEVSATIQQQLLGEASIALTIIPAMTLKKITTVVALRAAQ